MVGLHVQPAFQLWRKLRRFHVVVLPIEAEVAVLRSPHFQDQLQGLPALLRALKLQKRAARVGFDWPGAEGALAKLREEIDELSEEVRRPGAAREKLVGELGDVLFSVVNLARKLDMDPEAALRHGNAKFERRFRIMERQLKSAGRDLNGAGLDEMEAGWRQAKAAE